MIDLSWASSRLEGNTYTRLDTRELIEQGKVAHGKATIELLVENAETIRFNRYTLFNLHSALSENLLPNPGDEGRLRQHAVEIGKSVYRPLLMPARIEKTLDTVLEKASAITDPYGLRPAEFAQWQARQFRT